MVLEELIGHGVAHLIVFAAGLCPEVGALLAALRAQDVPHFLLGADLLILLYAEQGEQGEVAGVVDGGHAVLDVAE